MTLRVPAPALATDRSMRIYDADGHLRVEKTNISKANICPYYGREIPNWEALGLDANRVYKLYRDPAELAKAAHTFAGKPVLLHHIPVSADEPAQELIVGAVGSDVAFKAPYLQASLTIWTREGIDAIESERQRELSCAYRYVADMRPGVLHNASYDGRMVALEGNHVALVAEGRAGPDVVVADEVPRMKFPKFLGALVAAMSVAVEPAALAAMDSALSEELAGDGFDLTADERMAACDAFKKELGKDALSDEETKAAYQRAAKDKAPAAATTTAPPHAADEAVVKQVVADAVAAATKDMIPKADAEKLAADAATAARADTVALYDAREVVAPKVGVVALDSAEAVYRFALDKAGVPHKDVPASALAALYAGATAAPIVQDAAPAKSVNASEYFPGLAGIRR